MISTIFLGTILIKRILSIFLGFSLLISFNHAQALQTKYLPLLTNIAAIVGGIVGYNWNNNIDGEQLVHANHNAAIKWLFKKIHAEQNPKRAVVLYRALRALLCATISGGVTYGIAYLFTPWGLQWLAGLYLGNKLDHPIAKGKVPESVDEVLNSFPGMIHQDHSYTETSSELSCLYNGLSNAKEYYQKTASYADFSNPQEKELEENCIEQVKKIKPALSNINVAQCLIKKSEVYRDEMNGIRKEERNRIERNKAWAKYRKTDTIRERNYIEREKLREMRRTQRNA